jgi:putative transposase
VAEVLRSSQPLRHRLVVDHRTVEIAWTPSTSTAWATFTASRMEAARLWGDLVERHHRIRRLGWRWPTKARWETWVKRRYPLLHSQTAQILVLDFLEAVASAKSLRSKGHAEARYPWRKPRYHDVPYSNQGAKLKGQHLVLPHGKAGKLSLPIPATVILPGRMVEARLFFGKVLLVCQVEETKRPVERVVGCDLGVNSAAAATDGVTAVVVSGREAKATVQWRNKRLASAQQALAPKTKGSRRHRRLQRRTYAMLAKASHRLKDLCHKTTAKVVEHFPNAKVFVGEPFNDAARRVGRRQAQQVSSACCRKIIGQLGYKSSGATVVPEPFSSQACPACGCRQRCRRVYRCQRCGFEAPRDVVGSLNIRQIGRVGARSPTPGLEPPQVVFLHPTKKYPGKRQVVPADTRQVAQGPQRL